MSIAVDKVSGVGPKTVAYLAERGIHSVQQLLDAGAEFLLHAPGFHENRARAVLANAAILLAADSDSAKVEKIAVQEPVVNRDKKNDKRKKDKGSKQHKGRGKEEKIKKEKKKDKKKNTMRGCN